MHLSAPTVLPKSGEFSFCLDLLIILLETPFNKDYQQIQAKLNSGIRTSIRKHAIEVI